MRHPYPTQTVLSPRSHVAELCWIGPAARTLPSGGPPHSPMNIVRQQEPLRKQASPAQPAAHRLFAASCERAGSDAMQPRPSPSFLVDQRAIGTPGLVLLTPTPTPRAEAEAASTELFILASSGS